MTTLTPKHKIQKKKKEGGREKAEEIRTKKKEKRGALLRFFSSLPHETARAAVDPHERPRYKHENYGRKEGDAGDDAGQQRDLAPPPRLEVGQEHWDGKVPVNPSV